MFSVSCRCAHGKCFLQVPVLCQDSVPIVYGVLRAARSQGVVWYSGAVLPVLDGGPRGPLSASAGEAIFMIARSRVASPVPTVCARLGCAGPRGLPPTPGHSPGDDSCYLIRSRSRTPVPTTQPTPKILPFATPAKGLPACEISLALPWGHSTRTALVHTTAACAFEALVVPFLLLGRISQISFVLLGAQRPLKSVLNAVQAGLPGLRGFQAESWGSMRLTRFCGLSP